jgi:hypothetical protein
MSPRREKQGEGVALFMCFMALLSALSYVWMVARPQGLAIIQNGDGHYEFVLGQPSQKERDAKFFDAVTDVDAGRYADAETKLKDVVAHDPQRHLALYMLAYSQRRLTKTAEATLTYENYLGVAGDSKYRASAAIELAYLYLRQHKALKAQAFLGPLLTDFESMKDPETKARADKAWKRVLEAAKQERKSHA